MSRTKSDYALLWANGLNFGQVYDVMVKDIRKALAVADNSGPLYLVERTSAENPNKPFRIREIDSDHLLGAEFGSRKDAQKQADELNAEPHVADEPVPYALVSNELLDDEVPELQARLAAWETQRAERLALKEALR